jgi:hypothetical protein
MSKVDLLSEFLLLFTLKYMLDFIQNSKESIENFQLKKLVGADMYRWNLKLIRHKSDFVFISFPCIGNPILFSIFLLRTVVKQDHYITRLL